MVKEKTERSDMASEKQIAANRANAMRSRGPKTAAGRLKSSRNAFLHGLSGPVRSDPVTSAKIDAIAHALAGEDAAEDRLTSATDFAGAQLVMLRIRSTRTELLAKIDPNDNNLQELRRLAALDRYERYALTNRRRASVKF
jgi:hypothetical protein